MYDSHITSNGALCHDRTASAPESVRQMYVNDQGQHLCLFGAYDAPREQWVNPQNVSKATDAQRMRARS